MRIAISLETDQGLQSRVSGHFGRCPYILFADLEEGEVKRVEVIQNPHFHEHRPGQVPEFIQQHGGELMISGGMGRRARAFFEEMGVQTAVGAQDSAADAIEQYLRGELPESAPCSGDHHHDGGGCGGHGHGAAHHHDHAS
ncbi:MAG: NifB/NifX family molybdenum-iron cluster-binding protein [Anaerolineales bacterium]|jgi:predicted Fe-Mo cluster-binding NifX family protein